MLNRMPNSDKYNIVATMNSVVIPFPLSHSSLLFYWHHILIFSLKVDSHQSLLAVYCFSFLLLFLLSGSTILPPLSPHPHIQEKKNKIRECFNTFNKHAKVPK